MSEDQRVTLTIHEYCSISAVGIWFECLLVQLVPTAVYGDDPAQPHLQWALTELADECPDNRVQPEVHAAIGLVAFLHDVGLVGGASELLWRRARLV